MNADQRMHLLSLCKDLVCKLQQRIFTGSPTAASHTAESICTHHTGGSTHILSTAQMTGFRRPVRVDTHCCGRISCGAVPAVAALCLSGVRDRSGDTSTTTAPVRQMSSTAALRRGPSGVSRVSWCPTRPNECCCGGEADLDRPDGLPSGWEAVARSSLSRNLHKHQASGAVQWRDQAWL